MLYQSSSTPRRKGVVLLVVMAMLALFAALGISFVFYADAVAYSAEANRLAMSNDRTDVEPDVVASYFLREFIYGTTNPYSAMRGHSLGETLYGYNPGTLNYTPFNGPGRASYTFNGGATPATGLDSQNMVSFVPYSTDPFVRDPGAYQHRMHPQYGYKEGTNVPWTAPDRHNMFLAVMAADGKVMLPSFHRPWTNVNPDDTTVNSVHRYLTLRPHGSWHPGFAPGGLPDSEFAIINGRKVYLDVKNNEHGPGFVNGVGYVNNDSIWMDLGFPATTGKNGKRYKPLFAPLVIDISNRLNLWVHGNRIGNGQTHVSSQGWGSWEVNLNPSATAGTIPIFNAADVQKPFALRYGGAGATAGGAPLGLPMRGLWFSKVDFDGLDTGSGASTQPFGVPSAAGPQTFTHFPLFPASGFENTPSNAAGNEGATGKPGGMNIFNPVAPNIPPAAMSNMEWLLRYRGTNSPAITSELARQFQATFNDPVDPLKRRRNMMTLWSMHLDRIAAPPVIRFDPNASPEYRLVAPATSPTLNAAANTPIDYNAPPAALPAGSEFGADWRSVLGTRLRVNLNRTLPGYPPLTPVVGTIAVVDYAAYDQAVAARVEMAKEIFNALIRVTGAQDPNTKAGMIPASPEYLAARWLAQLAVNMVDYIDSDDYQTPFNWYGTEWVFGTELPRVVINEVYAQNDNNGNDPMIPMGMSTNSRLNVWVELHNPFKATGAANISADPRDDGRAELVRNGNPVYELMICKTEVAATPKKMRDADNVLGDPDPGIVLATVNDWGLVPKIDPSNGAYAGTNAGTNGFFVLGPSAQFLTGRDPFPNAALMTATHQSTQMSITQANVAVSNVMVLLRRLANPHMPAQPNPAAPRYNPFITVDYVANVQAHDNREYDGGGKLPAPPAVTTLFSVGRRQPYAAHASQWAAQIPNGFAVANGMPRHTFFRHNGRENAAPVATAGNTLDFPFDWLTHLDRPLVNPLEVGHVSGFKQHELTQEFITNAGKFRHYAPWSVQDAMIYRVLDLLTTGNQLAGTYRGGRQPGLININTVTEEEIMQALADANSPQFSQATISTMFQDMLRSRTPNSTPISPLQPTDDGRPFRSFGTGQLADTWVRLNAAGPNAGLPVFGNPDPALTHPYLKTGILQKLYNNVTTTSNVFAVWLTVGYFEVVDESVKPARLGAELGRQENRHVRHRFFAIVDRSGMSLFNTNATTSIPGPTVDWNNTTAYAINSMVNFNDIAYRCIAATTPGIPPTNATYWTPMYLAWNATQTYRPNDTVTYNGFSYAYIGALPSAGNPPTNLAFWSPPMSMTIAQPMAHGAPVALQTGMLLEIGTGATAEVVRVEGVGGNTFSAAFTKNHAIGSPVVCRGNPGPHPQGIYNPHRDSNVVLHMSVIK
jgi:hypothetical protein